MLFHSTLKKQAQEATVKVTIACQKKHDAALAKQREAHEAELDALRKAHETAMSRLREELHRTLRQEMTSEIALKMEAADAKLQA